MIARIFKFLTDRRVLLAAGTTIILWVVVSQAMDLRDNQLLHYALDQYAKAHGRPTAKETAAGFKKLEAEADLEQFCIAGNFALVSGLLHNTQLMNEPSLNKVLLTKRDPYARFGYGDVVRLAKAAGLLEREKIPSDFLANFNASAGKKTQSDRVHPTTDLEILHNAIAAGALDPKIISILARRDTVTLAEAHDEVEQHCIDSIYHLPESDDDPSKVLPITSKEDPRCQTGAQIDAGDAAVVVAAKQKAFLKACFPPK